MDIILFFLGISLLSCFFSMAFKENRKNAKESFKEAVVGGLGAGVAYLIIFVLFVVIAALLIVAIL